MIIFRILVAGDGPSRADLELLAENLGVTSHVTFLGYVEEPALLYGGVDLMVIPSRSEEGPICLYESWLMGVPVVASDAPVLDERIHDYQTGLFFKSEDPVSLAEKILELYNNKPLQSLLVETSLRDTYKYSINRYQESLHDLYSHLC